MRRAWTIAAVWIAFLADLLVGAGLLLSQDAAKRDVGLAMLLLAVAVLAALTLAFYVRNRRAA